MHVWGVTRMQETQGVGKGIASVSKLTTSVSKLTINPELTSWVQRSIPLDKVPAMALMAGDKQTGTLSGCCAIGRPQKGSIASANQNDIRVVASDANYLKHDKRRTLWWNTFRGSHMFKQKTLGIQFSK